MSETQCGDNYAMLYYPDYYGRYWSPFPREWISAPATITYLTLPAPDNGAGLTLEEYLNTKRKRERVRKSRRNRNL